MCVAFFFWEHPALPDLHLLALFNRDEVLDRPTAASHFWEDRPAILGGRDLVAGGTWLCISKHGRVAFLTNFREVRDAPQLQSPSRGALPVDAVSAEDPEQFLASLDSEAYPGFNLVAADLAAHRMLYLCNKHDGQRCRLRRVEAGLHGITNGHMDVHWPKVDEGCARLQQLLESGAFGAAGSSGSSEAGGSAGSTRSGGDGGGSGSGSSDASQGGTAERPAAAGSGKAAGGSTTSGGSGGGSAGSGGGSGGGVVVPWEDLFGLLSDDQLLEQDPERLPRTGWGPEFEARNSSIFVQPVETRWGPFGTRSKIVLAVWQDGRSELRERYMDEAGSWQEAQHSFQLLLSGDGNLSGSSGGGRQEDEQQQQPQSCGGKAAAPAANI